MTTSRLRIREHCLKETVQDTKCVIRSRNSMKDRQYNDLKKTDKKTNNGP